MQMAAAQNPGRPEAEVKDEVQQIKDQTEVLTAFEMQLEKVRTDPNITCPNGGHMN